MGTGKDGPSKIFADLDAYMQNWKPIAVADNTRVAIRPPQIEKLVVPSGPTAKTLRKGDSGKVVSELRIRLAGFGGVLPGTEFDDSLEKAVKQFEKDVMARAETGIVDNAFAVRLDQFAKDWSLNFEKQLKCDCSKCTGFGSGRRKGEYSNAKSKLELYHKYEYPGIHRSLLWASRAIMFYCTLDHKDKIRFLKFSSGYRCHDNNAIHKRSSTNHMGKAVDMAFEGFRDKKWTRDTIKDLENVKKDANSIRDVAQTRMNAQINWGSKDRFSLEPGSGKVSAPTWVHMDVREWSAKHLADEYFAKSQTALDGDPMVSLLAGSAGSGAKKTEQATPQAKPESVPQTTKPATGIVRPAAEKEQLLAAVVYCESRSKHIGGEDADEKDAIAACFVNRVYYGGLSKRNGIDFGTTLLSAIKVGSVAYGKPTWNKVMTSDDAMKSVAELEKSLTDPSDREHFRLSCEAAARYAGKIAPIAMKTLENRAPAAFNQAANSPPGKDRLEKIGRLAAHTFYGFVKGREAQ